MHSFVTIIFFNDFNKNDFLNHGPMQIVHN